jgi:hypothetical protein
MATQLQGPQKVESARQRLTKSQFDQLFKQISNWGRWGKEDQLGTLNLITAERRRQAAELVKPSESQSYVVRRDISKSGPLRQVVKHPQGLASVPGDSVGAI